VLKLKLLGGGFIIFLLFGFWMNFGFSVLNFV